MIPKTGRAIILENNQIISIKRTKYNDDGSIKRIYYTFPGGHVEGNESYEEAAIREVYEELGLKVEIRKEFMYIHNEELNRDEKFFQVNIKGGKLGTGNGPEFKNVDYKKYGKYEIVKINIKALQEYNLLPMEVKNRIIDEL